MMLDETTDLKSMGQVARSSSTRAYAGHSVEMRHIFDLKQMNLTEYARAFGLYKQLYFIMQQDRKNAQTMQKRGMIKHDPTSNFKSIVALNDDLNIDRQLEKAVEANQNHFSRKL